MKRYHCKYPVNLSQEQCRLLEAMVQTSRTPAKHYTAYPKAFNELKAAGLIPESCELRQGKYLNNLVEQDHRFIKRLTKPSMGFFSFETAWRTLQGYEIMNIIRKGQLQGVEKGDIRGQIALVAKLFGRAA